MGLVVPTRHQPSFALRLRTALAASVVGFPAAILSMLTLWAVGMANSGGPGGATAWAVVGPAVLGIGVTAAVIWALLGGRSSRIRYLYCVLAVAGQQASTVGSIVAFSEHGSPNLVIGTGGLFVLALATGFLGALLVPLWMTPRVV